MVMRTRTGMALAALGVLLGMSSLPVLAQPPVAVTVDATVQRFAENTVTVATGESFSVTDQTRVFVVVPATTADLVPGVFISVVAQRRADGALEASVVYTNPEALRGLGEGQAPYLPLDEVNLMTNATIDDGVLDAISGGELSISFLGQSSQVHITGRTRIRSRTFGSLADIFPGVRIRALARDGVAANVFVE